MDAIDFLYREKVFTHKCLEHAKLVNNERDRVMYHERMNYLNVLISRARAIDTELKHRAMMQTAEAHR